MAPSTQTSSDDQKYSLRTQISLSPALRKQIDALKKPDESLSEFIRRAVKILVENEQKDKRKRIAAAKKFIGCSNPKDHPEWKTLDDVSDWQREIRKDRPNFLKLLN